MVAGPGPVARLFLNAAKATATCPTCRQSKYLRIDILPGHPAGSFSLVLEAVCFGEASAPGFRSSRVSDIRITRFSGRNRTSGYSGRWRGPHDFPGQCAAGGAWSCYFFVCYNRIGFSCYVWPAGCCPWRASRRLCSKPPRCLPRWVRKPSSRYRRVGTTWPLLPSRKFGSGPCRRASSSTAIRSGRWCAMAK